MVFVDGGMLETFFANNNMFWFMFIDGLIKLLWNYCNKQFNHEPTKACHALWTQQIGNKLEDDQQMGHAH